MSDDGALGLAVAAQVAAGVRPRQIIIPSDFAFDRARYPIAPEILTTPRGRRSGKAGYDPFASTAYQNCRNGRLVWMSPTGNDTSGDGSPANPFAGLAKCQQTLNAAGVPGSVMVKPGNYTQTASQLGVVPIVDTATVVSSGSITGGGVAWLRTWVAQTWTVDATYINLWKCGELATSVSRVVDTGYQNAFGNPTDYIRVASLGLCALMPGSYFADTTGTWCNPFPGRDVVSNLSTHILRQRDIFNTTLTTPVNLFWDCDGDANAFLLEGGQKGSHVVTGMAAAPGIKTIVAARGIRAICGGSNTYGNGAFYANRCDGLVFYERCFGGATWEDVFNVHSQGVASGVPVTSMVTLNCAGNDAGRVRGAGETVTAGRASTAASPVSCNYWTGHDKDVAMIDIAGEYGGGARGQGMHLVGQAMGMLAGTRTGGSLGDIAAGGTFHPAEIRAADTARIWVDGAEPQPISPASWAMLATDAAQIRYANMLPALGRVGASGSTASIAEYQP